MNWRVLLIALLPLCGVAWAQPKKPTFEDDRLIVQARRAGKQRDVKKQVALLERLTTAFPASRHAKGALWNLAQLYARSQDQAVRAKALDALRRLHTSYKQTPKERQRTVEWARQLGGWQWSRHPSGEVAPGEKLIMERGYGNRADSVLTVYRIPRKTFADTPWKEFDRKSVQAIELLDAWRLADRRVRPAKDHRRVRVPFAVNTRPVGVYVVVESVRGFQRRTVIEVRSFQLYCRFVGGTALVLAYDHRTGEPIEGVRVMQTRAQVIDDREQWKPQNMALTDAAGLARFTYDSKCRFTAHRENEWHVALIDPERQEEPSPTDLVHISTDRPIYRPGQTIHFKAIHRRPAKSGEGLERASGKPVAIELRDPRGRLLQTSRQTWSELGTVTGSFLLPDEPALGRYSVLVRVLRYGEGEEGHWYFEEDEELNRYWQARIRVAAYRKPDMEVKVAFTGASVGGSEVKAQIAATYFSGGRVANAQVTWSVERVMSYDWRRDSGWPRLPFEDPLAWFYERKRDNPYEEDDDDWGSGKTIAEGVGKLAADGTLEVRFNTRSHYWPEDYILHAEVRDLSRLTGETAARKTVEPSSLGVTVGADRMFYMPGEAFTARVRVRDLDGQPIRNSKVDLALFEGRQRERDLEFEQTMASRVETDAEGYATWDVKAPRGSRLRIRARVADAKGRITEDRADLIVVNPDKARERSEDNDVIFEGDEERELLVVPDRVAYRAGDTARLLVSAPSPCLVWMSVEGRKLHDAKLVRLTRYEQVIEVPLKASYGHHLRVVFFGWNDRELRGGAAELFVVKRKPMRVKVEADKSVYRPQDKARLVITTTHDGKPVPAEVELAIVDRAVLSLEKDRTPELRGFFQPLEDEDSDRFPRVYSTGSVEEEGLSFCEVWSFDDRPQLRKRPQRGSSVGVVFDEGGGGESEPHADANAGFAATSTRRWFPDTMAYVAKVTTGADGRAVVEVDMPDSLTRWRVLARGITANDQVGQVVSEVLCRKPVVLRLSTPRFYTQGDKGIVTTVVHNRQPIASEFTVKLTVDGKLRSPRTLRVGPGELARIDWPVEAGAHGSIQFKAEALSKTASDAITFDIPVKVYGFRTHLIRSGRSLESWKTRLELPREGRRPTLELSVSSSGLSAVTQALPSLIGYPYGCVEQTMSRFLPSVVAARALKRLGIKRPKLTAELPSMVKAGLRRLVNFQHEDGGWGWWKHDESDPRMTAYVVFGLITARDAGFEIEASVIKRGLTWLEENDDSPFALFARSLGGKLEEGTLEHARENLEDAGRPISARAYLVLAGDKALAKQLSGATPVKATPLSVQTTALVLRALASVDPKHERIPALVDWLLRARRGAAWFSTLDSAYAIFALTAVMDKEPAAGPKVTLGGKPVKLEEGYALLGQDALTAGALDVAAIGKGYVSARLSYFETRHLDKPSASGIEVTRRFEKLVVKGKERTWVPLESGATIGATDELRVTIRVRSAKGARRVMIDCPIPAGTEARASEPEDYDWWESWYVRREMRDDKVCLAASELGKETHVFTFRLRPTLPGTYRVLPAHGFGMYDPDTYGRSAAFTLTIKD